MHQIRAFPGRIIFDHLPKTAGQAVNAWLIDHLGAGCVTTNLIGQHRQLIRKYGGEYSIISAHVDFQEKEGLDPRYQYLTVLREPIARTISWIFFLINNVPDIETTRDLKQGAQLFLASDGMQATEAFWESITNPYSNHFSKINGAASGSDAELVDNCISTLKQYSIVGFQEDLDNFLKETARLIGIEFKNHAKQVNVTIAKKEADRLSARLLDKVIQLNAVDAALYQKALIEFKSTEIKTSPTNPSKNWDCYNPSRIRRYESEDIVFLNASLVEGYSICKNSIMTFNFEFASHADFEKIEIGIHVLDENMEWAFGINSSLLDVDFSLQENGDYQTTFSLIADLPYGIYTAGFAIADKASEHHKELFWHDKLCQFEIVPSDEYALPGVGYSLLPAAVSLRNIDIQPVKEHTGYLTFNDPDQIFICNITKKLKICIFNASAKCWTSTSLNPINLSYHWLDASGAVVVYEGLRTPIPSFGITPQLLTHLEVEVASPEQPGEYTLVLTLVQEGITWFEEKGFQAAHIAVTVLPV